MSSCRNRIPGLCATLCIAAIVAAGASAAQADGTGRGHQGPPEAMQGQGGHAKGQAGRGPHRGGGGMHGKGHGKGQSESHLFGPDWRSTLTAEQKAELDRLHVEFAKTKAPLMAGIEALKVRLAVLVTSEQPEPGAIDGLIEELLPAKRELMSAKYNYRVAQRGVLTPPQQISFDMEVLHRAMHRQEDKQGRGGRSH